MNKFRTEHDLLGEKKILKNALYGIHTLRAMENFKISGRTISKELISAFGFVKLACLETNFNLNFLDKNIYLAIKKACEELIDGKLNKYITVDALQGGAGTSTNMNINEVIANRALLILGKNCGDYHIIHPNDTINLHQSTNDTYPTALKVAAIFLLRKLEKKLINIIDQFQKKEKDFADIVKVGRTQMQDAVLVTLGREMGAYAEAFGRDRWRIFKCEERLRVINLGGTAVGTGIGAPRQYIFKASENLKQLTGLGLARAENLFEATQNNDEFVEVSGILNACASNLMKIASDIRFMSSGPEAGISEITIPARQAGSSIMPGKINPVIPEAVIQGAIIVQTNSVAISNAVNMGSLELNPFMPLIADKLIESLSILINITEIFTEFCIKNMQANQSKCNSHILSSTALLTSLITILGYEKSQKLAEYAKQNNLDIKEAALKGNFISESEFNKLIQPESVNRLGTPTN